MIPDKAIEAALCSLERIAVRLEQTPFGSKCISCGHASSRHNELAYCLVGQCSCEVGSQIASEALFIRREIQRIEEAAVPYLTADATPDDTEAWEAYRATRDQWRFRSDVLPEHSAFLAGRVSGRADALIEAANECDVMQMAAKVDRANAEKGTTHEFFHYGRQRAFGEARIALRQIAANGAKKHE